MARRIKEKTEKINQNKDTRPYATVRYVRLAPTKAKIVADLVKGKKVDDAVAILSNMPQDAAKILLKVVNSAAANATNNKGLNASELFVAEIIVNAAHNSQNKVYARGKGGMNRITTKTSHIKVVLDVKE